MYGHWFALFLILFTAVIVASNPDNMQAQHTPLQGEPSSSNPAINHMLKLVKDVLPNASTYAVLKDLGETGTYTNIHQFAKNSLCKAFGKLWLGSLMIFVSLDLACTEMIIFEHARYYSFVFKYLFLVTRCWHHKYPIFYFFWDIYILFTLACAYVY